MHSPIRIALSPPVSRSWPGLARARVVFLFLCLSTCSNPKPVVVLDLAEAYPAIVTHSEVPRIDLGATSEAAARLHGFSPARFWHDRRFRFRSVMGEEASITVWLFRRIFWRIALRYRLRGSRTSATLHLAGQGIVDLPPASHWTEVQGLLSASAVKPGGQRFVFRDVEPTAKLEIDWLELRPISAPTALAQPPVEARRDFLVQPVGNEWIWYASVQDDFSDPLLRFGVSATGGGVLARIVIEGGDSPFQARLELPLSPADGVVHRSLKLPGKGPWRVSLLALSPEDGVTGRLRWEVPRIEAQLLVDGEPAGGAVETKPTSREGSMGRGHSRAPKDIFLFVLDAARADRFGFAGNPRKTSPWIDGLAKGAIVFQYARASAPYTVASTASLMTSLEPETHGVRATESRLSEEALTLAEILAKAGYSTAAYIGCPNATRPFGFAQGFELFAGGRHDRTMASIRERLEGSTRNFFYVHLFPPHHPYHPPMPFQGIHSGAAADSEAGTNDNLMAIRKGRYKPTLAEVSVLRDLYDENLLYGDALLGEILGEVARQGRLDGALIIVMADHGEAFYEHGNILHGLTLYEEEIRIPLLIRLPAKLGAPPALLTDVVSTIDLLPTIVGLAGASDPRAAARQGRSLEPLLRKVREEKTWEQIFTYSRAQGRQVTAVLVGKRFKIHLFQNRVELYDILSDPGETQDLAAARPYLAGWLRQQTRLRHFKNLRAGATILRSEERKPDEETERQLRSLGYID